jgi:predicted hydrocarbon binding protein
MPNPPDPHYVYSDKLGKILLLGLKEILGSNGLNALLNMAELPDFIGASTDDREIGFEDLSKILVTLEKIYGPHGGHGVALRTGRACYKYSLQEFGPELGTQDMGFRLLPPDQKLVAQAERLADLFNANSDQRVRVQENEAQILWQIDRCPACWGRRVEVPVCHLAVGLLQEACYWVSGGKLYNVEEKSCIARGDPSCTVVIDKQPFS